MARSETGPSGLSLEQSLNRYAAETLNCTQSLITGYHFTSKERRLLHLLVGDVEMFVGQPRRYPAARGATEVAEL